MTTNEFLEGLKHKLESGTMKDVITWICETDKKEDLSIFIVNQMLENRIYMTACEGLAPGYIAKKAYDGTIRALQMTGKNDDLKTFLKNADDPQDDIDAMYDIQWLTWCKKDDFAEDDEFIKNELWHLVNTFKNIHIPDNILPEWEEHLRNMIMHNIDPSMNMYKQKLIDEYVYYNDCFAQNKKDHIILNILSKEHNHSFTPIKITQNGTEISDSYDEIIEYARHNGKNFVYECCTYLQNYAVIIKDCNCDCKIHCKYNDDLHFDSHTYFISKDMANILKNEFEIINEISNDDKFTATIEITVNDQKSIIQGFICNFDKETLWKINEYFYNAHMNMQW